MATKKKTQPAFKFIPATFNLTLLSLVVDALGESLASSDFFSEEVKESIQNALTRAHEKLQAVPSRIVDGRIIVASDSGNVYAANRDDCQCTAFTTGGKPCWHRAAYVIVTRYNQASGVLNSPVF